MASANCWLKLAKAFEPLANMRCRMTEYIESPEGQCRESMERRDEIKKLKEKIHALEM